MPLDTFREGMQRFHVTVDISSADDSSESTTMLDMNASVVHQGKEIAKCQGILIRRSMMRDPQMFPYLMEVTQELEEVAKDYGIFHPALDGTMTTEVILEYFERLNFFADGDFESYRRIQAVKDHPCNRAWILYFSTLTVDEAFRRRHIGQNLLRRILQKALHDATAARRPLLAGVRPGFLGIDGQGEAASVQFWKAMGFERYPSSPLPALYFWSPSKRFPDKQGVRGLGNSEGERSNRLKHIMNQRSGWSLSIFFIAKKYLHRRRSPMKVKRLYVQLELPATKVPSEFSQPHVPSSGLSMQLVPTPLDSPSSLKV